MARQQTSSKMGTGLAAIAVLSITVTSACGGDDEPTASVETTAPMTRATPATAPPTTVDAEEVELVAWCIANAPISIEGPSEEVEREMADELAQLGQGINPPAEIAEADEIYRRNAGPDNAEWRLAASQIERFWGSTCGEYVELGTRLGNP